MLFWVGYLLFFTILDASFYDDYWKAFLKVVTTMPIKMAATYLTLYVFIPNLLDRKKYASFAGLFLLMGVIFGYIARSLLHIYWVPTYVPDYDYAEYPLTHLGKAAGNMISVYTVVFAASAIKLLKRNYQNEKITEQLNKEKLDAELKFLKSQIHPHFLFNTLNNLYALTLKKSDQAPEIVLKLSEMMRYMLYECNEKQVLLRKEVDYIRNYLDLERLRQGDNIDISFEVQGNIRDQKIAPLMFTPFLENSFKHGLSNNISKGFVNIKLTVADSDVHFFIENSKPDAPPKRDPSRPSGGIGLVNIHRRLKLLYDDQYELDIVDSPNTYAVNLMLNIENEPQNVQV